MYWLQFIIFRSPCKVLYTVLRNGIYEMGIQVLRNGNMRNRNTIVSTIWWYGTNVFFKGTCRWESGVQDINHLNIDYDRSNERGQGKEPVVSRIGTNTEQCWHYTGL